MCSLNSSSGSFSNDDSSTEYLHEVYYGPEEDEGRSFSPPPEPDLKKQISVGDYLPYGFRLYYSSLETYIRMKDIGENRRIIVVGVLGAFTPDCWNRHLFLVLKNLRYYEERQVDYIACVATSDAFLQQSWGEYLCCEDEILMLSDSTKRFTTAMGMDVVLPWLDNSVRSKRYVLMAEDMLVTKMIVSNSDGESLDWQCEHLFNRELTDDEEDNDDTDPWT